MLKSGKNNKKSFKSVKDSAAATERGIRQAFFRIGKDLTDDLSREMLKKDKKGQVYFVRINGRRRRHRASAPGQTAANLTGTMRKARGFQLKGSDQLQFGIRGDLKYPRHLEIRLMRESLGNSVKNVERNTDNAFLRSLKRELV